MFEKDGFAVVLEEAAAFALMARVTFEFGSIGMIEGLAFKVRLVDWRHGLPEGRKGG